MNKIFKVSVIFFFFLGFVKTEVFADKSLKLDDDFVKDTLIVKKDTIKLNIPLNRHGSLSLMPFNFDSKIVKSEFLYNKYQTFSELIKSSELVSSLSLSNMGQFNQISFFGLKPNYLNIMSNGRSILSAKNGLFHLDAISPEFLESIEILTGSKSVVLSDYSSPFSINLQEIKYNTKRTYTKFWYFQGGYEALSADGVYSQNIAPNLNFTFGFKRISSPGKYENTWTDLWNLRSSLRWNFSENTNISFSENFVNAGYGNNGGLDKNNSNDMSDRISSTSYLLGSDERNIQHNLNLSFSHYFDSLTSISSIFYFSNSFNEQRLNPEYFSSIILDTTEFTSSKDYSFGVNTKFEGNISIFNSISGFDFSFFDIEKTNFNNSLNATRISVYDYLKISLNENFILSGGARLVLDDDDVKLNFGANILLKLDENQFFDFDYSITNRKYFLNEINQDFENIRILKASYFTKNKLFTFNAIASFNQIGNYLFQTVDKNGNNILELSSKTIDQVNSISLNLNLSFNPWSDLFVKLKSISNYSLNSEISNIMPILDFSIDSYYEFKRGESILRLGIESQALTGFNGYQYIPFRKIYAYNQISNDFQFDGLSVYINAKFSDAYVKLIFSNIIGTTFYNLPYNPIYERQIKMIVNWPFLD